MAMLISEDKLTDAWLADIECLHHHGEQLNLVTTIASPDPKHADTRVIASLDDALSRAGKQAVSTVANTIFPEALLRGSSNRQGFYQRYLALLPRMQKQKGNGRGTYFGRLINYPQQLDLERAEYINQIERIIQKLEREVRAKGPKRFIYQAQIFNPGTDASQVMGFPCLSFLSFQLDKRSLCLTAIYRNHFYFQRALGNFIGLARLQQFVADAAGLELGSLTIHACHAVLDVLSIAEATELIRLCRREIVASSSGQSQIVIPNHAA